MSSCPARFATWQPSSASEQHHCHQGWPMLADDIHVAQRHCQGLATSMNPTRSVSAIASIAHAVRATRRCCSARARWPSASSPRRTDACSTSHGSSHAAGAVAVDAWSIQTSRLSARIIRQTWRQPGNAAQVRASAADARRRRPLRRSSTPAQGCLESGERVCDSQAVIALASNSSPNVTSCASDATVHQIAS